MKEISIQNHLLILLLLADIVDLVLFTLSTTCFIKANLKRDVELQNAHIVLFKSPQDMLQVSTLSAQLGLGSELVDWYLDETYVPYGHFLTDFSPGIDVRLHYCTNTGSIPSKFYIPDRLKQSKILDEDQTKSLHSPSVAIIFPQMQRSFFSVFSKRVYPVSIRMQKNRLKGNLQSIKIHHVAKNQS